MTNVYGTPEKASMKAQLFAIAVHALEKDGWKVERERGSGKSSVRRITKKGQSKLITIRTSQDTWIAFPRTEGDKSWRALFKSTNHAIQTRNFSQANSSILI